MDVSLFSARSLWTMFHGMVLGGIGLLGLGAALFALRTLPAGDGSDPPHASAERAARELAWLLVGTSIVLWLAVLVGTYVSFPPYRAKPPEGLADLAAYPKALIQSRPETRWLHGFAMEIKEHVPWIASMPATAAAFVAGRYRRSLLRDAGVRRMTGALVAISFVLVAVVSVLGVFVNKVAPLQ